MWQVDIQFLWLIPLVRQGATHSRLTSAPLIPVRPRPRQASVALQVVCDMALTVPHQIETHVRDTPRWRRYHRRPFHSFHTYPQYQPCRSSYLQDLRQRRYCSRCATPCSGVPVLTEGQAGSCGTSHVLVVAGSRQEAQTGSGARTWDSTCSTSITSLPAPCSSCCTDFALPASMAG